MRIVLASASPRRKELIRFLSEDTVICPAIGEEICPKTVPFFRRPEYLSALKAEEVARKYPDDIVIGCDTAVFFQGKMLGKPKDEKDAENMLLSLSGKRHEVISGVTVIRGEKKVSFSERTKVYFRKLSEKEILEYIKTGESMDKAGAYGIQGQGALFVKKINGDYFNVVGFPISKLSDALRGEFR